MNLNPTDMKSLILSLIFVTITTITNAQIPVNDLNAKDYIAKVLLKDLPPKETNPYQGVGFIFETPKTLLGTDPFRNVYDGLHVWVIPAGESFKVRDKINGVVVSERDTTFFSPKKVWAEFDRPQDPSNVQQIFGCDDSGKKPVYFSPIQVSVRYDPRDGRYYLNF